MQELRIAAFVSKEPVWIDAFINKRDLHGEVASMVFGVDVSEVKSKPDFLRGKSYRDVAKTVNFCYQVSSYHSYCSTGLRQSTLEQSRMLNNPVWLTMNFIKCLGVEL